MKSLILKDLYNISTSVKTMALILALFAVTILPNLGTASYVAVCTVTCGTLIITTFSLDDMSKWNRYALITPVTRRNVVTSKYILLLIFSLACAVVGVTVAVIAGIFMKKFDMTETLVSVLVSLCLVILFGSVIIPLIFKYGAEKARMFLIICFILPTFIFYGLYALSQKAHVQMPSEAVIESLLWLLPLLILAIALVSIKISCATFNKKELT